MTAAFIAKAAEIKVAAVADILSLVKLTPPGEMGAAVVLNYTTFWYSSRIWWSTRRFFSPLKKSIKEVCREESLVLL
jgi:hypothetical protein